LCVSLSYAAGDISREAVWITEFEQGMQRAQRHQRAAFVYFDADWCSWCQQYKRDTLDKPEVRERLAYDYIAVRVDYDARPDLFERYGGKGMPFTVILAPDGRVLNRFVGVMTPVDLVDTLAQFARDKTRAPAAPVDADYPVIRVERLDHRGYEQFRQAFLNQIESLYHSESHTLSGRFETGATLKRPSPLTWIYLLEHGLWPERGRLAAQAERRYLLDRHDGGFFNFLDPSRLTEEYLETSKILESNAWLGAWMAQLGVRDPAAYKAAHQAWFYLREVLWDGERGGFWQAQMAANEYYVLPPAQRLRKKSPPIDYAKRADTNAQAAWALVRMGRFTGNDQMLDYAARTMDFLLFSMYRDDKLYHIWRGGRLGVPDLAPDWFWLLAAGHEVERVRPDRRRRARLDALADMAGAWLQRRMQATAGETLGVESIGLIAWAAGKREFYPAMPAGASAWALRQLRIEVETSPDELVLGLLAWENRLAGES